MSGCEKEVDAWMQNEDGGWLRIWGATPTFGGAKFGHQLPRGQAANGKTFVSVDVFK